MTNTVYRSATQLAKALMQRQLACVEALDCSLARFDAFDSKTTAVMTKNPDAVRARALQQT